MKRDEVTARQMCEQPEPHLALVAPVIPIRPEWSDPEPRPCKWCDSEGRLWLIGGGTEPCPECDGLGVVEHGF